MWLQGQSLVGLVAIPAIAWAISERRWAIAPARLARILVGGVGLQVLIEGLQVALVRRTNPASVGPFLLP